MMSRRLLYVFVLGIATGVITTSVFFYFYGTYGHIQHNIQSSIFVIASPDNGRLILNAIDSANKSIYMEMYLITSQEVIDKLKNASARGVDVKIILEKRVIGGANEKVYSELKDAGIDVRWAAKVFARTHSKLIMIDRSIAIVGSHNLSNTSLKKNREISVMIIDQKIINTLTNIFFYDWNLAYG